MKESKLYCLVMAGGQGTRFWPSSVTKKPKQYLPLVSDKSLLEETLVRFDDLVGPEDRYVITVKAQEQLVKDSAGERIGKNGIIFEPSGRNTGPCILLSLANLVANGASESDVVAIVPSDHVILNHQGFKDTLKKAAELSVGLSKIVTIGIKPNFPHTGFGYIHRGEEVRDSSFDVKEFKEKPDLETAKNYVASGEYFWNAGMFVGTIDRLLKEFESCAPEMFSHYNDLKENANNFEKTGEIYEKIPKDSIDYAIMEKSKEVMTIPAEFDWNDLGSWDALETVLEKENDNYTGQAKGTFFQDAKDNIVFAPGKFVSLIDVNGLVVVSTEDNVLVVPKEKAQEVKKAVEYLKTTDFGKEHL